MIATNRIRWSDNDTYFGPFLYALDKYRNLCCVLGSGDGEEHPGCRLRVSALGHTLIMSLPPIINPWKRPLILDGKTYYDNHEREYGFSYGTGGGMGDGGFLQVFLGRQTHDSSTTQSWSCFTPWNNWRHVRHSYYGIDGNHYWTEPQRKSSQLGSFEYEIVRQTVNSCPTKTFSFTDFDGELIECKTRIEEMEWRLGTGYFKWLSWFKNPIIRRSLDLDFSKGTGRRKGSWKGGTTGHAIEMLPGELHESAFRRYCEGDDNREGEKRDMKFIGEVQQ